MIQNGRDVNPSQGVHDPFEFFTQDFVDEGRHVEPWKRRIGGIGAGREFQGSWISRKESGVVDNGNPA